MMQAATQPAAAKRQRVVAHNLKTERGDRVQRSNLPIHETDRVDWQPTNQQTANDNRHEVNPYGPSSIPASSNYVASNDRDTLGTPQQRQPISAIQQPARGINFNEPLSAQITPPREQMQEQANQQRAEFVENRQPANREPVVNQVPMSDEANVRSEAPHRITYSQSVPGGDIRSEARTHISDSSKATAASETMRENLAKLNYAWNSAVEIARKEGTITELSSNRYDGSLSAASQQEVGGYISGLLPPVSSNPTPSDSNETDIEAWVLSNVSKERVDAYKRLQKSIKTLPTHIPKLAGEKPQQWYAYLKELSRALVPDDVWKTVTHGSPFWVYPTTAEQAKRINQSPSLAVGLPKQPKINRIAKVQIQELEDQLRFRYAYNMFIAGTKGINSIEGVVKQVPAPNITVILHRVNSSYEMSSVNAITIANSEFDRFYMKPNEDVRTYTNRLQGILTELALLGVPVDPIRAKIKWLSSLINIRPDRRDYLGRMEEATLDELTNQLLVWAENDAQVERNKEAHQNDKIQKKSVLGAKPFGAKPETGQKQSRTFPNSDTVCYRCGKLGHIALKCTLPGKIRQAQGAAEREINKVLIKQRSGVRIINQGLTTQWTVAIRSNLLENSILPLHPQQKLRRKRKRMKSDVSVSGFLKRNYL